MKKYVLLIVIIFYGIQINAVYQNKNSTTKEMSFFYWNQKAEIQLNGTIITHFFKKHPNLHEFQQEVLQLYKSRKYASIWYKEHNLIPLSYSLYAKLILLNEEGVHNQLAYKEQIESIFKNDIANTISPTDKELLLSSQFIYFSKKVYYGIDSEKHQKLNWFIPRKKISYNQLLDSLIAKPQLLEKNESIQLKQYYKLKAFLKKYEEIEKRGDWNSITPNPSKFEYHPDDSSKTIRQIRHRLFVTGDLNNDSKSTIYDAELMAGILKYKKRNGYSLNYQITNSHIYIMNIPIEEYIKTIKINMERCRWILPEITKAEQYVWINIPSYLLQLLENGKTTLESNVFVGKSISETTIFSDSISQIVFNPYWNVPKSIKDEELKIAMANDKNYLISNNMEWHNGTIRQKPGGKNPMGQIKFMFPNEYAIYLHDSPSKSLFESEYRALSHGCINMNKAKELALLLLKNEPEWPTERIESLTKGNKETVCTLKKKIPIFLVYFTAWVNDSGEIGFYNDLYERDDQLAKVLFLNESK